MNNSTVKFIMEDCKNLLGKPADVITSFLKSWGGSNDPTMAKGLLNLLAVMEKYRLDSIAKERIISIAIGAGIGVAVHFLLKYIEKKESQKKMREIAEILKQEASLENEEQPPVNDNIILED